MDVKQIQYRSDPATVSHLKSLAAERGTSVNALIDESVHRLLDEAATEKFARWAAGGGADQTRRLWQAQQAALSDGHGDLR